MKTTYDEIRKMNNERTDFFEALSQQFITMTGCGAYVYLDPVAIDGLFDQYLNCDTPVQIFLRKCVKNVLG